MLNELLTCYKNSLTNIQGMWYLFKAVSVTTSYACWPSYWTTVSHLKGMQLLQDQLIFWHRWLWSCNPSFQHSL